MSAIYLLRHQRGGVLSNFAFVKKPTEAQMEVIGNEADSVFGPGWLIPYEVEFIENEDVPPISSDQKEYLRGDPGTGKAKISGIVGYGIGTVIAPNDR